MFYPQKDLRKSSGGMAERSNALAWKAGKPTRFRGFESPSLRHIFALVAQPDRAPLS